MNLDPHELLRNELPLLAPLLTKVVGVHGEHNPKLLELRRVFLELRETLEAPLDPAGVEVPAALGLIRELTDGFTAPAWACGSYRRLLVELEALQAGPAAR